MRRKEGFSLVELLIVLAVMAALIATITPVALNAIRKAKATQVGQNLKTLASAFENAVYVNGEAPDSITDLGRDIDTSHYAVYYTQSSGTYTVVVATDQDVDESTLEGIISNVVKDTSYSKPSDYEAVGDNTLTNTTFYYRFSFTSY